MDRGIPVASKLCFDRNVKRSFQIHQQKLRTLKPMTLCHSYQSFRFLSTRLKQRMLSDVRNTQIARQNNKLYTKIKTIVKRKPKWDDMHPRRYDPHRKQTLLNIINENQKMRHRIQGQKSVYSVKRWKKERQTIEMNINLISQFQYKDYPPNKTGCNFWATNKKKLPQFKFPEWKQIFKKVGRNNNQFYQVIISQNTKFFKLTVQNLQKQQQVFNLHIPINQAQQLLTSTFDNKIQNLADAVVVDFAKQQCFIRYLEDGPASGLKMKSES